MLWRGLCLVLGAVSAACARLRLGRSRACDRVHIDEVLGGQHRLRRAWQRRHWSAQWERRGFPGADRAAPDRGEGAGLRGSGRLLQEGGYQARCRGPGAVARRRRRGRVAEERHQRLRPIAGGVGDRSLQGLRQGVHEAAQDPDGRVPDLQGQGELGCRASLHRRGAVRRGREGQRSGGGQGCYRAREPRGGEEGRARLPRERRHGRRRGGARPRASVGGRGVLRARAHGWRAGRGSAPGAGPQAYL
mmetsp:Transcript_102719/g.296939  ORF Transcript_102719/g.296939 Transcript_102719/m.296939 type:complete len:247 (-) Transcript_102719:2518-3258(-)